MTFDTCRDILSRECELVKRISNVQNLVWDAVMNRNWTDFEDHFNVLGEIGAEFSVVEAERERLFAAIMPESGISQGFYALIAHFPAGQRNELSDIYRDLKLKTLQVKMKSDALMDYITEARATMAGFVEIAFPDRGGKLYTPHGNPVSHDMRSMVLDRAF